MQPKTISLPAPGAGNKKTPQPGYVRASVTQQAGQAQGAA
jgi:hypothetical protein